MDIRNHLRQNYRKCRQQLTAQQQLDAANALILQAQKLPSLMQSKYIAYYLPHDNEIDPRPLMHQLTQMDKIHYLPALDPQRKQHLLFIQYQEGDELQMNRYRIPEPIPTPETIHPVTMLEIIFLPLVAFDLQGNRLGMGAGYYDQTLAWMKETVANTKPMLVGLAYECQKAENLPAANWDIPLHAIMTEQNCYLINSV